MKNLSKIALTLSCLTVLVACHGTTKVDFEKFQSDVNEKVDLEAKCPYSTVTVKGKYEGQEYNEKDVDLGMSLITLATATEKVQVAFSMALAGPSLLAAVASAEDKDTTYYIGNGYKVVATNEDDEKEEIVWGKDGYILSLKEGKETLKFTYKK